MRTIPLEGDLLKKVGAALKQSPFFGALQPEQVQQLIGSGTLLQFEHQEALTKMGEASDAFFLILKGEASVRVGEAPAVEVSRLGPSDTVGEMGVLLEQPRSAGVVAEGQVMAVKFDARAFHGMFQKVPHFGLAISRALARRVQNASRRIPLPEYDAEANPPTAAALQLLPTDFVQRQRVLPLKVEGNVLTLGFVDDPTPAAFSGARQQLPSMELRAVRVSGQAFDKAFSSSAASSQWKASMPLDPSEVNLGGGADAPAMKVTSAPLTTASSPRLDQLLRRMVAEGASDLHLSAGHKPRWRLDGEIGELQDTGVLSPDEVFQLLEPVMRERNRTQFESDNDSDFAYALKGVARFRVNLFRDHLGVSAVFRQIPDKILTFEQLGLPPVAQALSSMPKGLVLVTGPTGSGKSTTLAAMIDHINRNKKAHIITLEDPIEFVHKSQKSLVNQREIGPHTNSFARALKAALREDPDIVLVGEMRDLETVSLALETANTGHLVFGTLHTSTAVSTVDRIIGLFPPEQQNQIRNTCAEVLKGVIAQTLCRKIGGGRVAALEILVCNHAVANLIRENKNHQISSAMSVGKSNGNQMLNEELARLVAEKKVEYAEALSKAVDKADLAKRCGQAEPPK